MRIDTDGLKALYQAQIRRKTPASLKDCPSPKKIIRLLRSGSSDKEATEIIDHISACSSCFSEFEFLLEVLRQEKSFIQQVEQRLPNKETEAERKEERRKTLGGRPFVLRFSWRAAFVLAGFVLVGFFMAKLVIFRPAEKYRAGSLAQVELVGPIGEKTSRSALVFRWKKVHNSEYYILELFDKALSPVWASEKITDESALLPVELTKTLEVNQPYFWLVTAHMASGENISSRLEQFILKE